MRRCLGIFTLALLLPGSAQAADPLSDTADRLAAAAAPSAQRMGDPLRSGPGVNTDWSVTLSAGQCYWFSAVGMDTIKTVSLSLLDPDKKQVAQQKQKSNQLMLGHCPKVAGRFYVQAKTTGTGPYRVVVYQRPGKPGDVEENGTLVSRPPPAPAPQPVAAPAPPRSKVLDDGPAPPGGNAAVVVFCDCAALEMYVDGQFQNFRTGQGRWERLGSGYHSLKVVAWTGPFSRKTWFDGMVNLWPNLESRFRITPSGAELVGKTPLAPPVARRSTSEATAQLIDDGLDILRDAAEVNRDQESRCSERVSGKLEVISELLKDTRRAPAPRRFAEIERKLGELAEYIEDSCPPRLTQAIQRKLGRLSQRMKEAQGQVDAER